MHLPFLWTIHVVQPPKLTRGLRLEADRGEMDLLPHPLLPTSTPQPHKSFPVNHRTIETQQHAAHGATRTAPAPITENK